MSEDTTTYVVHVNVSTPEEVGRVAAAAGAEDFTEVRFSALERGERRPLNQRELGVALQLVARATDARRDRAEASHAWDADNVIAALESIGHEDAARDLYGDERVDEWFRGQGVDPDVERGESSVPPIPGETGRRILAGRICDKVIGPNRARGLDVEFVRLQLRAAELGVTHSEQVVRLARAGGWDEE